MGVTCSLCSCTVSSFLKKNYFYIPIGMYILLYSSVYAFVVYLFEMEMWMCQNKVFLLVNEEGKGSDVLYVFILTTDSLQLSVLAAASLLLSPPPPPPPPPPSQPASFPSLLPLTFILLSGYGFLLFIIMR